MRFAPVLVFAVACVGVTDEDWQLQSHVDEGTVCVDDQGTEIAIHVTLADCMSSSCSRAFSGSCEAALIDDATITLTSTLSWEQNVASGAECTDDCGIPEATCTLPAVPEGSYTIQFGGDAIEITVPATEPCSPF
ncbi:MAG: hypothetical protein ABMB14_25200 [Myxococcota bacterium]